MTESIQLASIGTQTPLWKSNLPFDALAHYPTNGSKNLGEQLHKNVHRLRAQHDQLLSIDEQLNDLYGSDIKHARGACERGTDYKNNLERKTSAGYMVSFDGANQLAFTEYFRNGLGIENRVWDRRRLFE